MKHCHCGLKKHFCALKAKKLGVLGAVLFVGHILFHVVECLILPAIFVGFSGHLHEDPAIATDASIEHTIVERDEPLPMESHSMEWNTGAVLDFRQSLELYHPLNLASGA